MKKYLLFLLLFWICCTMLIAQDDPYLWLEEVKGDKSMEFVNAQNKITLDKLMKAPDYQKIYDRSLEMYNSTDKIAVPTIYGDFIYNFWQDKEHVRGIWRRSPSPDYISGNPKWEILLDIDEMSAKENEKWVYKGAYGLYPSYNKFLVALSKGGGDAVVIKEFDIAKKSFIEDGFRIDESKGEAGYVDENTVVVSTDFGENTMTSSGYPRQVKIWKRGTQLKDAKLVFEGEKTDVSCGGWQIRDGINKYTVVMRGITFYSSHTYVWHNDKLIKLEIPDDCQINVLLSNQLVISLKSDWSLNGILYKQGSLISLNFSELLKGNKNSKLILQPDEFTSIFQVSSTKNKLLVNILRDVKNELYIYTFNNREWLKEKVNAPDFGTIFTVSADELTDRYFFLFTNFLVPSSLYFGNAQDNSIKLSKSLPAYFDASKFKVDQYKAKSIDGTMIPYFVVSSKIVNNNGENPTLLNAYGGFESPSVPFYDGALGYAWLEKGGVFVLANIRGGGEYGPKWHLDGIKDKRQNVYNDFHAVAEDLIARNITNGKKLGITGASNGGLLVGVAFTERPDLYNAVVCAAPLLDMKRYNKLLAGASWMGEYGNPDLPEEWEYIKKYSPYQNLKSGVSYPEVFFYTATTDDRVHPGHARKMAAKMIGMGYPVYFYENTEGGHAGSATAEQLAKENALEYSYLLMKLK